MIYPVPMKWITKQPPETQHSHRIIQKITLQINVNFWFVYSIIYDDAFETRWETDQYIHLKNIKSFEFFGKIVNVSSECVSILIWSRRIKWKQTKPNQIKNKHVHLKRRFYLIHILYKLLLWGVASCPHDLYSIR